MRKGCYELRVTSFSDLLGLNDGRVGNDRVGDSVVRVEPDRRVELIIYHQDVFLLQL